MMLIECTWDTGVGIHTAVLMAGSKKTAASRVRRIYGVPGDTNIKSVIVKENIYYSVRYHLEGAYG
jgi:hypothetical protein